ncbi:MAG: DUF445 family protein, partial [Planctomycetia bacterium]|nr:DUF445 family protein [Planctomycetia bacterium]
MPHKPSRLARWFPKLVGLIAVARDRRRPASTRRFAIAEVILFPLSVLTVAGLVVFALARIAFGVTVPDGWLKVALTMLSSGAVGYLTNYVAVRMLFEPYSVEGSHWLRAITLGWWRLGLVPARQKELAKIAGAQIARLLPPKTVADELTRLLAIALDDSEFRLQFARALAPAVREAAPELVKHFAPEVVSLLGRATTNGLTRENLRAFYDKAVEPLLADARIRDRLADGLVHALREHTPVLISFARAALERYQEASESGVTRFFRSAVVNIGEAVGAIDWQDIESSIHHQLETHESREQLLALFTRLVEQVRENFESTEFAGVADQFRAATSEFVRQFAEKFLTDELPTEFTRLAESDDFWHWLAHDGLDRFKPAVLAWLNAGGVKWLAEKFDVSGRVEAAICALDVPAVHAMVDAVA